MIRSKKAAPALVTALAAALGAASAYEAAAQGTVTLSSGGGCQYSSIRVEPNGNLTVTCGAESPTPVCTLTAPSQAVMGQAFNLSASCTNSPTTFNWTSNASVTLPTGSSGSVTIATQGTYTFSVSGTNPSGTGAVATRSVSVVAPADRAPTCTNYTASPSPATVGQPVTITMTCDQAPTTYAWAMYDGGPQPTGFSSQTTGNTQSVTFSQPGTYLFAGQAGNGFGGSNVIGMSVKVDAVGNPGGCSVPTNAVGPNESYTTLGNMRFDLRTNVTGYRYFDHPLGTKPGGLVSVSGATNLETPKGTVVEVAIAKCPGDFNVPAACRTQAGQGLGNFYFGTHTFSSCPLEPGKYSLNVRLLACTPSPGFNACTYWVSVGEQ